MPDIVETLARRLFATKTRRPATEQQLADWPRMAEQIRDMRDHYVAGIVGQQEYVRSLRQVIQNLTEWDFIAQSADIIGVFAAWSAKLEIQSLLLGRNVERIDAKITQLGSKEMYYAPADEIDKFFRNYAAFEAKLQTEIGDASRRTADEMTALLAKIHKEVIEAWVKTLPKSKAQFVFDQFCGLMTRLATTAGAAAPPGYASIGSAVGALIQLAKRVGDEVFKQLKIDEYKKTNLRGEEFDKAQQDPAMMASSLYKDHIDNINLTLTVIGAGMGEIRVWPFIRTAISSAAEVYFKAKLNKLRAELDHPGQKPGTLDLLKEMFDPEELKKVLINEVKAAVAEAAGDPTKLPDVMKKTVENLMIELVARLVAVLPIDPAQAVNGDDLTDIVNQIAAAARPQGMQPAPRQAPVQRGAAPGPNDPTQDSNGRAIERIDEARSTDAIKRVLIRTVWGDLDLDGVFTPIEPDETRHADWSTRKINQGGYLRGTTQVDGNWYRPWPEKNWYLFEYPSGQREWANGLDNTGRGGGTDNNVARVFADLKDKLAPGIPPWW